MAFRGQKPLRRVVFLIVFLQIVFLLPLSFSAPGQEAQAGRVHEFFHRHPKLKKFLIIGGIGAATGGIGAAVLGTGVAAGAATGAGTHIAAHEAIEKYKEHKAHKQRQQLEHYR